MLTAAVHLTHGFLLGCQKKTNVYGQVVKMMSGETVKSAIDSLSTEDNRLKSNLADT